MATQPALMSIEEYLHTSYRPDVDFVDGYIEERNLGEFDHARQQALIASIFVMQEAEWGVKGVTEQRIRVAGRRVRIADLALLRADAPYEQVTATPPLLCVEVMSPEDRIPRVKARLSDYLHMGVEYVWLIDPVRRLAYTFDAESLHEQQGELIAKGTDIRLDVDALFRRLDK